MPNPRSEGPPPPSPAPAPDPATVDTFEALTGLGVAATLSFHAKNPEAYARLRSDYFSRLATPARRPLISR